jgi:hypothetical protein
MKKKIWLSVAGFLFAILLVQPLSDAFALSDNGSSSFDYPCGIDTDEGDNNCQGGTIPCFCIPDEDE